MNTAPKAICYAAEEEITMADQVTSSGSQQHPVASHSEWVDARRTLLVKEKEFTRLRDELSRQRRELPWEKVDKDYSFEGAAGQVKLADLFAGKHQLIVYHFMLGPDWEAGCKSCSFWADNLNGIDIHLAHRDTSLVVISRAPLAKLDAYKKRMGWSFDWYSSFGSDFNFDYQVSFTPEQIAAGQAVYNYELRPNKMSELVGISVFYRDDEGDIFHTYSCYSRGVDMLNGAYHYLDLTSKGRDEAGLPHTMAWVRRRDEY
jgi:predicted dithiol-disulfide oxidoreductase (DUF899 family)